jgi:hypothetical protein
MPYHLRKMPGKNLYKVYGEDGKPHSKEGLTLEMAKKQLTALNIAYAREKGHDIPFKKKVIMMPVKDYMHEHIRLVGELRKHGALVEARRQAQEAARELGIRI